MQRFSLSQCVGQVAEVFVNGKSVGKHIGSYTRFQFPISDLVKLAPEGNTPLAILVKVDNSHDENIPPLSADFTFYGGIYRDVYLVAQNKLHFNSANFASNGVFISTPKVSAAEATVRIKAAVTNKNKTSGTLNINHAILDSAGKIIASKAQRLQLSIGETKDLEVIFDRIKAPELWSVDRPYLYSVVSTITDTKTNVVVDEISN
ncbi:MAG: beta-galactosidase, partial [Flavobacteriales bacterium]